MLYQLMNFTNNEKSDYRIANYSAPLQAPQQITNLNTDTDTVSSTESYSDTNSEMNININLNSNITTNTFNHSRFATLQFSPSLEDFANTVSFASLNVRGINSPTKFKTILEDLTERSFSVIGLQETKIKENSTNTFFNNFSKRNAKVHTYKAYWDYNPQDAAAGVGLIIASYISKYVQRIHRKDGRFIALDLFLPNKKLKIINLYAHQGKTLQPKVKLSLNL